MQMDDHKMRDVAAKQRRGAILPLTVILLVVLVGMVAFAVDLGYLSLARTEIQAAADAGALAGALAVGDEDPNEARVLAKTAAEANRVAGSPVVIVQEEDVELGVWNKDTFQFTKLEAADQSKANSVRVTCRRTSARRNPIALFFAPVFGVEFGEASASAVAIRRPLCGAFIGLESVDLNGNGAYTDSYDSNLGTYGSQTPGAKGSLCSNGSINVQNGVVNGDALPGPGHEVSIGGGSVTGSTTPREEPLSVPPVDFGDVMTNNDNDQLDQPPFYPAKVEFRHNGGGLNLDAGTYYFTKFSLSGGPVVVNGAVKIYVSGDFTASGDSFLNATDKPRNLQIFATGKAVKISGSSDFTGIVYAPSSDIEVGGGGSFFGAVVGKTLKFHNDGGIHADESVLGPFPTRSRLVD